MPQAVQDHSVDLCFVFPPLDQFDLDLRETISNYMPVSYCIDKPNSLVDK